jgi:hypothetical protein
VDADGNASSDILTLFTASSNGTLLGSQTLPGWSRQVHALFVFDSGLGTYVKADVPAETPKKTLDRLTRGAGFAGY